MVLRIPIKRKSRCSSLHGWMKLKLLRENSRNSPAEEKVRRCSELCELEFALIAIMAVGAFLLFLGYK